MKRAMLALPIIITLIVVMVSAAAVWESLGSFRDNTDVAGTEGFCKQANQATLAVDETFLKSSLLNACRTIDLSAPLDAYRRADDPTLRSFAEKIAKTWEIWLDGASQNYFASCAGWGGENCLDDDQQCFIQYTFEVAKGKDPFTRGELLTYLAETPYRTLDASDRCAGVKGGTCRSSCQDGENEADLALGASCPSSASTCCVAKKECVSKGGECARTCFEGTVAYPGWACGVREICCIEEGRQSSYLDYIQRTGAITVDVDTFYPQGHRIEGEPIAETYAIVFASRTTAQYWLSDEESEGNVNRIIITPLGKAREHCEVQLTRWS